MKHYEEVLLQGAKLIAQDDCTVRAAAAMVGVSKTGLHNYVCGGLQRTDMALYRTVQERMKQHLEVRHIHGGEATKQKYAEARRKANA